MVMAVLGALMAHITADARVLVLRSTYKLAIKIQLYSKVPEARLLHFLHWASGRSLILKRPPQRLENPIISVQKRETNVI